MSASPRCCPLLSPLVPCPPPRPLQWGRRRGDSGGFSTADSGVCPNVTPWGDGGQPPLGTAGAGSRDTAVPSPSVGPKPLPLLTQECLGGWGGTPMAGDARMTVLSVPLGHHQSYGAAPQRGGLGDLRTPPPPRAVHAPMGEGGWGAMQAQGIQQEDVPTCSSTARGGAQPYSILCPHPAPRPHGQCHAEPEWSDGGGV